MHFQKSHKELTLEIKQEVIKREVTNQDVIGSFGAFLMTLSEQLICPDREFNRSELHLMKLRYYSVG